MMLLLKGGGALATTLFRSSLFTTQRRRCFCVSNMSKPVLPKFVPVKGEDSISRNTSRSSSNPHGCKFRIVSYNILAQVYVKSSIFPYSPKPSLRWKARSEAIMTVLKSLDADFLCLQELDEYNTFYKGNIESNDYSSIYAQRSGDKRDGCGIFYKHSSAELVLEEKIEYNDLVDSLKYRDSSLRVKKHDDAPSSGSIESPLIVDLLSKNDRRDHGDLNDPRVRLKRDCVGLMTAFKLKDHSGHLVIVANTHLYWNPELADVKLAQAKYLLLRLAQFKEIISKNFECMPSVIVCGDFNSTPGDKVILCL
ncbi:hypothetical protein GIB67_038382 [Kingdonia uniflora]|uniref:Endonuclease/exonuclease/phosphatase domain-containing protein n=1 Tax=Kingdonia uniflora TaxID=39325 RepID=A0A7J7NNW9_9MAGN|nr:hypothetical protein GIB67_038382 [Kingdonia uniflora]